MRRVLGVAAALVTVATAPAAASDVRPLDPATASLMANPQVR
jgi:hypothetical protein